MSTVSALYVPLGLLLFAGGALYVYAKLCRKGLNVHRDDDPPHHRHHHHTEEDFQALRKHVHYLSRKVEQLMATQAELKNALDVSNTNLDAVKAVVDKLVANSGGVNIVNQAQLDAFVTQAQSIRAKTDALAEAAKGLDTPGEVVPGEGEGSGSTSGGTFNARSEANAADSYPTKYAGRDNSDYSSAKAKNVGYDKNGNKL